MRLLTCSLLAVLASPLFAQVASATPYGSGCYRWRTSFYELFPGSQPFDLAGVQANPGGFTLLSTGSSFVALPLLASWRPPGPTAVQLQLADDQLSPPLVLGFSMPFPTGFASAIVVSSNGYVLPHGGSANQFTPSAAQLLAGPSRLCVHWMDHNPGAGGAVFFETDAVTGTAWVTFDAVPEFGGTGTSTFQIALRSFGEIDLLYGPTTRTNRPLLVGWSPGGGARDPLTMDLSAVASFLTQPADRDPLALAAVTRPIVGTTLSLTLSALPPGSLGGIVGYGLQQFAPGIDLGPIGMDGCAQHIGIDGYVVVAGPPPQLSAALAVPAGSALLGVSAFVQGVASAPTQNALQLISSNGLALLIGAQ